MGPLKKLAEMEHAQKAVTFVGEFKAFALKGNIIDLAVGVIIGAAFGKIVESLVKNIIMPVINLLMPAGQPSYVDWAIVVGDKKIPYGLFLGEVLNFLIIALALFLFTVKFLGWIIQAKKEEPPSPALSKDQELLMEIRDLLKQRSAM